MKLVVEVIDAHDLMPKDGAGSASPFVEVDFQNQLSRTKTIPRNLNPIWNQKLLFDFDKTRNHHHHCIEVSVYHERRPVPGRSFLGRVRISCSNLVRQGDEVYQNFQLENKSFLTFVKGEIGLKIYTSSESDQLKSQPFSSQPLPVPSTPKLSISDDTNLNNSLPTIPQPPIADDSITLIEIKGKGAPPSPQTHTNQTETDHSTSKTPIQEQTSVIEQSGEVRSETTTHHIHKHQVLQQSVPTVRTRMHQSSGPTLRRRTEGSIQVPMQQQQQQHQHGASSQPHPSYGEDENNDFEVKEASLQQWPNAGGRGWMSGERMASTLDLVEQMFYLYVRVVKAKDLSPSSITASCDPYVEVKLGNYKGRTRHFERKTNPEWNQVFAFSKDRIQSSILEVLVKDKDMVGRDEHLGKVVFDLNEVPTRVPPDSPLAPQWYRMEDRRGEGKVRGEIMAAVWMGTQADEAFTEAWHADAASVYGDGVFNIRSKVYVSPKLWYLRVNVIEAQDIVPNDRSRLPEVSVKVQVGNQVLRSGICPNRTANPIWNQDLVFVAAEPFEEHLVITVEDQVHQSKDDVLGSMSLPLTAIEKRLDHRPVHSRWFNLERFGVGGEQRREVKFSSRIHLRVCLEGGYHVLDESTLYISDQRPTAKQLWKPPVGILEVGILGGQGLLPMKMKEGGRGSTDAYCVAKYGQKWVRTRTVLDSFNPKWNEQYTWEVYDPCTVITLGVFDNTHLGGGGGGGGGGGAARDARIGKVRIRLSTLETHRVYTHSYPLLVLHPSGVKKMGELQLAVRFTTISLAHMIYIYGHPLLPKMHYLHPFTVSQVESLRYQAMNIVAARLGRAEPPLRKEVVEYMLDVDSHMWSMRRSKANFFRMMSLLSGLISMNRWFDDVCNWRNPTTSVLVHVLFLILIWYPELMLPTLCLYAAVIGLWNYRLRPRHPQHMDAKLSWAEAVHPDELDEEFDTFPTSKESDVVRMRYDRLRSVAGRIQTVVGDVATQGERVESLLRWRDPRATSLFIVFCLCAAAVLYAAPIRVVVVAAGLYVLRHPKFRSKMPSAASNFFRRLTARTDSLL
ncbi:C2 calcium/lipid-binding plant phosphoribosyltransferase family protein [Perilla frutescens var. hirtella]|uniref:C2 calcium/lipid-binding plant phosphoribosyltransferase family protein n=1 Tax=Perilla frutescens var. hirtella TaxID=608512 RepID=A0AAD4ISJ6_PERFH|nr:C2 calcium/lipid-binding plant phosphoribosyltransferase family protein [Perilla frutescens var. hirtella]